jgi:hypothetical protein
MVLFKLFATYWLVFIPLKERIEIWHRFFTYGYNPPEIDVHLLSNTKFLTCAIHVHNDMLRHDQSSNITLLTNCLFIRRLIKCERKPMRQSNMGNPDTQATFEHKTTKRNTHHRRQNNEQHGSSKYESETMCSRLVSRSYYSTSTKTSISMN